MPRILAALALACALSSHARAAETACPSHYLDGRPPVVTPARPSAHELCSAAFATLFDPATRDPVYAAEHLTVASVTAADKTARLNAFHADDRLPHGERAELSDYAGEAYDRGHLAPAHDMPTPEAMRESFALSNMAPQVPEVNRGRWATVEEFTRRLVVLGGQAFVVTVLEFDAHPAALAGRVAIPAAYLKAVYVPGYRLGPRAYPPQVGVYAVANRPGAQPAVISLDEMRRRTGVDPFPELSASDHARVDLPAVARQ